MAVGDFINGILASGTETFQPAGTNIICITHANWWDGYAGLTNGTISGRWNGQFNSGTSTGTNTKVFINNTNYLEMDKANPLGSIGALISQFAPMLPKNIQPLLQDPQTMNYRKNIRLDTVI